MDANTEQPWLLESSQIADALHEFDLLPRIQIGKIVRICGARFARAVLKQAILLDQEGGLMVCDGSHRRTLGGVFFYLARKAMKPDQRRVCFSYGRRKKRQPTTATQLVGEMVDAITTSR